MKQVNGSYNGEETYSQAILIWPSGLHGKRGLVIYPLGPSEEATELIRNYLEERLGHQEQSD